VKRARHRRDAVHCDFTVNTKIIINNYTTAADAPAASHPGMRPFRVRSELQCGEIAPIQPANQL